MKRVVCVVCVALFVAIMMLSNLFVPVWVESGVMPYVALYALWIFTGVTVLGSTLFVWSRQV